jgi:molybdopterin/thiamine biosynthesis adenylyltransferase
MKLRITERDYEQMQRTLASSFWPGRQPETGCILLVALNDHKRNPSLLVSSVLEPQAGDFVRQERQALSFGSHYLRRALLAVRERKLAGFLTVHTHPSATNEVGFSLYDDACDPELMGNLYDLQPDGIFGSAVVGASSIAARVWQTGEGFSSLAKMVVIGEQIQILPLTGVAGVRLPQPNAIFDRALPLTGAGALSFLSAMRIGVVGDSGTGSLMIELLLRAGAGEIVIFEFDKADKTNLNRVLHMRLSDVEMHRLKSERTAEVIAESGLPTRVTIVEGGDIRNGVVADELRGCDVLFGCVDRDWPRLILCEVAYQYLIPFIDLGTEIGLSETEVQSLDTRVSYIAPGRACLKCSGVIKQDRLGLEGQSDEELGRILDMGYNEDFRLRAPAVMELNMHAASWAGLLLRHLLQPFLLTPLPNSIRGSLTNLSTRGVNSAINANCIVCGLADRQGSGPKYPLTIRAEEAGSIGCIGRGPRPPAKDLSTNPRHFEGFGKSSS